MGDAGDLGVGVGDRVAVAAIAHLRDLRSGFRRVRGTSLGMDGPHFLERSRAHHRTDVSTFRFLHDYRPENNCRFQACAVHGCYSGSFC